MTRKQRHDPPPHGDPSRLALCIDAAAQTITTQRMTFEGAQQFVGGYLTRVRIDNSHWLYVDEEGNLKRLTNGFVVRNDKSGRAMRVVGNGVVFGHLDPDLGDIDPEWMRFRVTQFRRQIDADVWGVAPAVWPFPPRPEPNRGAS